MITIRNEEEKDRAEVEDVIRKAFWNLYIPGCNEHYLAHIMRSHPDFLPELDFVIELDGKIIGSIMYTRNKLIEENGNEKKHSHFRTGMHSAQTSTPGLRQTAAGTFI